MKERGLENLLSQVLNSDDVVGKKTVKNQRNKKVCLNDQSEKFSDAFSHACNCILELSSMPKYNNQEESENIVSDSLDDDLPDWLQGLLLCSTVSTSSLTSIQLSAITAVVELSTLVIHCTEKSDKKKTAAEGAVVVSMEPVMTRRQLEVMMTQTETVVRIAETLWRNLELSSVSVNCVSLLHR